MHRWRDEAVRAGRTITRIALAFEAGRDGFWLARWLAARGVEAHVIHSSSVAVSREHRRAKTDRLDTELLKRGFLGWLRGERGQCSMARVPTIAEENAKRPNRGANAWWGNATRIVNRIKVTLPRLGICNFKPTLRQAAERLPKAYKTNRRPWGPLLIPAAGARPRPRELVLMPLLRHLTHGRWNGSFWVNLRCCRMPKRVDCRWYKPDA